jgi:hypothetical protein
MYLYARDNIALVHIYIKDPYVTKLKRDEAFSIILFVAGAGGKFIDFKSQKSLTNDTLGKGYI